MEGLPVRGHGQAQELPRPVHVGGPQGVVGPDVVDQGAVVDDGVDALSQSLERRLADSQLGLGEVPADHVHPRPDLGFESRGP